MEEFTEPQDSPEVSLGRVQRALTSLEQRTLGRWLLQLKQSGGQMEYV